MVDTDCLTIASSSSAEEQPVKKRRAFMACLLCRDRKTKCVLQLNESSCVQCKESRSECFFATRAPKKRRTENEAQEMDRRIEALEQLVSRSTAPASRGKSFPGQGPPVPPISSESHRTQQINADNSTEIMTRISSNEPPPSYSHPAREVESPRATTNRVFPVKNAPTKAEDSMLGRLLSKTGQLSVDAGRLRYFGPSTSLYMFDASCPASKSPDPSPVEREASRMIEELSGETHAHILDQYWTFYNSIIEVVPKEPFLEGHSTDNGELYSIFLHLTMLAIGLRFVDKERSDVLKFMVSPYESVFHGQAKSMVESELDKSGRLPSVQALLLLGDLECGIGKDLAGWMYAGMACRLFFDLGLNLNSISLGLSTWEAEVRQKVPTACVMIDRCWSLFFVRPTCVKKGDLEAAGGGTTGIHSNGNGPKGLKPLQPIVYEAAMSLMEIASKVGDSNATRTSGQPDASSDMAMQIIHGELERWYKSLNPAITWNAANIPNATAGFFLLHQQYHAIRIMLHRPFVGQPRDTNDGSPSSYNLRTHFLVNSGDVCLQSGLQLARIFMVSSSRFSLRQSFITTMQHAATGVRALVEVLAHGTHPEQRQDVIRHLLFLKSVLFELGHIYQHASKMHRVVEMVLNETSWEAEYRARGQADKGQEQSPFLISSQSQHAEAESQKLTSTNPSIEKTHEKDDAGGIIGTQFELEVTDPIMTWDFSCDSLCEGTNGSALPDAGLSDWLV